MPLICRRLSRCCTARGSSIKTLLGGPSRVGSYNRKVENEKIISQIVGVSKISDQNGDKVSKNDKSCHICSKRLKRFCIKY